MPLRSDEIHRHVTPEKKLDSQDQPGSSENVTKATWGNFVTCGGEKRGCIHAVKLANKENRVNVENLCLGKPKYGAMFVP